MQACLSFNNGLGLKANNWLPDAMLYQAAGVEFENMLPALRTGASLWSVERVTHELIKLCIKSFLAGRAEGLFPRSLHPVLSPLFQMTTLQEVAMRALEHTAHRHFWRGKEAGALNPEDHNQECLLDTPGKHCQP